MVLKTMYKILYKVSQGGTQCTFYQCQSGHTFDHYEDFIYDPYCYACEVIERIKQCEEKHNIEILSSSEFKCNFCGLQAKGYATSSSFSFECGCQMPENC